MTSNLNKLPIEVFKRASQRKQLNEHYILYQSQQNLGRISYLWVQYAPATNLVSVRKTNVFLTALTALWELRTL